MKAKNLAVIALATVLPVSTAFGAPQVHQSETRIAKVSVYSDRAQVTRVAEIDLKEGDHAVEFANLPISVVDVSYRASARGARGLTLLGLSHRVERHLEAPRKKVAELEKQWRTLQYESQQALQGRLEAYNRQKQLLIAVAQGAGEKMAQDFGEGSIQADQWEAAYRFVGSRLFEVNDSIRVVSKQLMDVENRLRKMEDDLAEIRQEGEHSTKTVRVDLRLEVPARVELNLQYIVPGASWKPLYDARLSEDDGRVELSYYAEVSQNTGEDWQQVELTLSTARPAHGVGPGDILPWYLSAFRSPRITAGNGSIIGVLTDSEGGAPVENARVSIIGTSATARSDHRGRYYMPNIPPGRYTLKTSHVDYRGPVVTDVVVKSDLSTVASPSMYRKQNHAAAEGEETITVHGTTDNIRRFEVVSQQRLTKDAISKMPVTSVDQLLSQVAGVVTNDGQSVFIRGGRAGERAPIGDLGRPPSIRLTPRTGTTGGQASYLATFKAARPESVASGGEAVRTAIGHYELEGTTRLVCRPRNREGAYRIVTVDNETESPLMPGPVAIFVGPDFLGRINLNESVAPGQKIDLPFGRDGGVKVDREVTSYDRSGKSKDIKVEQTVRITLANHDRRDRQVQLEEILPVSQDSRISIKLGKIEPKPDSTAADGRAMWTLQLVAGEEKKIVIPYRLKYPRGMRVVGL